MAESSKPKVQRKEHYKKQLHRLEKDFSMHLSAALRKQIGIRSLEGRKDDTVKVMRGDGKVKNKQGKITAVLRNKRMVLVEGIISKKGDGTERQIPLRPSNLMIVTLNEKDSRRLKNKNKKGNEKKGLKKDGQ